MKNKSEKPEKHPYCLQRAIENFEQGYLKNILQLSNGDKVLAAEMLGIFYETLEAKMEKYDIEYGALHFSIDNSKKC